MRSRAAALAGALLLLPGLKAAAEVELQAVRWQLSTRRQTQVPRYEDVDKLAVSGAKLPGLVRAKLTLLNRGPNAVEGILLRFSVTARVFPKDSPQTAAWGVPFMIDEHRVPKLGPNQTQEARLDPNKLPVYLLKMSRAGFRFDQLRLQVMVEPRPGERAPVRVLESVLPIAQ